MVFVQTHIDWLKGHGVEVAPVDYTTDVPTGLPVWEHEHANGRGPLNRELLAELPSDLAEWYEARICDRTVAENFFASVALDVYLHDFGDSWNDIPGLDVFVNPEMGPDHIEWWRRDQHPRILVDVVERPLLIASWNDGVLVAEGAGPNVGWLYAFNVDGSTDGPFMRSLPDYLACVRALVDNGHLVHVGTAASSLEWLEAQPDWYRAEFDRRPPLVDGPPADTPAAVLGYAPEAAGYGDVVPSYHVDNHRCVSGSIVDLVPGLVLCPPPGSQV